MERVNLLPAAVARPKAPFSHGVLSRRPEAILHTAGQVGVRPDGSVPETVEEQFEQIYRNLDAVLAEAGMSMRDVVQVRTYLTDASQVAAHRAAFGKWLGEVNPVSTAVVVKSMVSPGLLAEVEAVAVR